MDAYWFRWALGVSEMITLKDVRARFLPSNYLWFDETVAEIEKLYRDEEIHFPSFVAGYLEVLANLKETYKKEPLLIIESLDGTLPKDFGYEK